MLTIDHQAIGNPLDRVLSQFAGVAQVGDEQWEARCPCHDDNRASLSIGLAGSSVLIHCHAGCPTNRILNELGMTARDLFPPRPSRNGTASHASHSNGKAKTPSKLVATYDYRDEAGTLLYQSCRMDPKDFRQRAPNPAPGGGWLWSVKGIRRILYRLPELRAYIDVEQTAGRTPQVFIVEGEKDADRLAKLGLAATTNVGGASKSKFTGKSKWSHEYSQALAGCDVVILRDNDDVGLDHANAVGRSVKSLAARVRVPELPGLPPKGDISDYLDAGGTIEQLLAIIAATPDWEPETRITNVSDAANDDDENKDVDLLSHVGRTEVANGRRFIAQHGDTIRWCAPWGKWLVWDGARWIPDDVCHAEALAKKTARKLWTEIAKTMRHPTCDDEIVRCLMNYGRTSNSVFGIRNMLTAARSEPDVSITPAMLDVEPWLFNCLNGTIDLRTGQLREHCRKDGLTKLSKVEFPTEPGAADCPLWEQTIDRIFAGNQNLITYLQRFLGYSLTGDISEQILIIWHGAGANGKSLVFSTLLGVMGDYAIRGARGMLLAKQTESHSTELFDLFGRRLVAFAETDEGQRLNESLIKDLTGGERIRARRMREDFSEFDPTHKVVLATNHKPTIKGIDPAIWRRIRLIPFGVTFWDPGLPENTGRPFDTLMQDKQLAMKLRAEYPGILAWMVRGCLDWQQHGLGTPAEVMAATAAYRSDEDTLGQFIEKCCTVDSQARVSASQFLEAYQGYTGNKFINTKILNKMMTERGYLSDRFLGGKDRGRCGFFGIGLLTESNEA